MLASLASSIVEMILGGGREGAGLLDIENLLEGSD